MKKRTGEILRILNEMYQIEWKCYLDYQEPWQLLIATILSAQCTDARVNNVTKDLFVKYPSIEAFAGADLAELEQDIRSTGFYHNKAKNIIQCCRTLHTEYHDELPRTLEELTGLAGVGRKTANVIRGNIFGDPSIVVDTHVKRISKRLGLTKETDPTKVEFDLMKELPKESWIVYNLQLITFGRDICSSQRPSCERCRLQDYCVEYREMAAGGKKPSGKKGKRSNAS